LFEHGYTSAGDPAPATEAIDSVTVGSTMPYFIMPDVNYNSTYFAQSSYSATDLTESTFNWTISKSATGTIAAKAKNDTDTSPWVEIKWNDTDLVNVTMIEESQSGSCTSDPVVIPVQVIQKPEIKFGEISGERKFTECVPTLGAHSYAFPVVPLTNAVISESWDVFVTYDVTFTPLNGIPGSPQSGTAPVSNGSFTLDELVLDDYGTYTIVITGISDKTSKKCTFEGGETAFNLSNNIADETFAYTMLPKPQPGKAYHVPNKYN
jgi:hypothetical protein